ncbi:MAG TPA: MarR family winged helix-turn-helix transcriptional regulator [Firmicutes bacterium]|nr:MarR family winged helix-turn-helix transcriptional regulator [Bacillota bacterium]
MQRNLIWTLKQLNLFLEQYSREQMKDMGLSLTQGITLHYLLSQKGQVIYASDLHTALGISKSAISVTLKTLKQKGYLRMIENPSDDRKKQIILTRRADKMEKKITSSLLKQQKYLCEKIPQQDLERLENDLNIMLCTMKKAQRLEEKI